MQRSSKSMNAIMSQETDTLCKVLWLAMQSPILSMPESTCNSQQAATIQDACMCPLLAFQCTCRISQILAKIIITDVCIVMALSSHWTEPDQ